MDTKLLAAVAAVIGFAFFIRQAQTGDPLGAEGYPWFSPTSYPRSIHDVGNAIAHAEGFYITGSAPDRAHNPGAIKVPGWTGPVTGTEGISVFSSDDQGWEALHRQLNLIATGRSSVYSLSMTIEDMARRWTATQQSAWARNVASSLGVPPTARLSQVLAA